ncbi:MAG: cbb3-type cytochrome c oxidase subunit 3 [Pseudomonadota bacterium]|mgnify:CR=1 FL=1
MNLIYEYAPTTGLIFFFTFFLWVAYRTYRPSAKQQMQNYGNIPLNEDSND